LTLAPAERALIGTGLYLALPPGYEGQIRPRSGNALKFGLTVLNSPGTVDADYRGEVKVLIINLGQTEHTIQDGDRIAQLVVAPVTQITWAPTETLSKTQRGEGGYGSTGT
jgi:dUTP pyrophosphatase